MSLSKISTGLISRNSFSFVAIRAGSRVIGETPQRAARRLIAPVSESGHFDYDRDWSRDSRYSKPQKLGDTPTR